MWWVFFFTFSQSQWSFFFFLSNTKTPDRMLYLKKCVSGLYIFSAMTATSIALMIHQWELFIFCIFIYIFLLNYWFNRNEYEKVTKLLLMYTSLLDRKIVIYSYMGIKKKYLWKNKEYNNINHNNYFTGIMYNSRIVYIIVDIYVPYKYTCSPWDAL